MKLRDIAGMLHGSYEGDGEIDLVNVGKIESASADEITFIANPAYERHFAETNAGAVIVSKNFNVLKTPRKDKRAVPLIRVDDPYLAFLEVLEEFSPQTELQKIGIHESAVVADSAVISNEEVRIGAGCFIGEKCRIGKKTSILPNTVLLAGSEIGDDVLIYPNVTIYTGTIIGSR